MSSIETLAALATSDVARAAARAFQDWREKKASPDPDINLMVHNFQVGRDLYLRSDVDPNAETEKRRTALLQRLTMCQNRILFEVSDAELVTRLVPFAIEQTTSLYTASKEAEFGLIEMGIGQLESMLARNTAFLKSKAAGRILAIWLTVGVVLGLILLIALSPRIGFTTDTEIPIIQIPVSIVLWSCIGSLGAMLYRFNSSADAELADPLRWSFTRPLTGILMGIMAYLAFKIGLFVIQPTASNPASQPGTSSAAKELLWVAAFLAGFSDRFADSVLRSLTGHFGAEKSADLVSLDRSNGSATVAMLSIADRLGTGSRRSNATSFVDRAKIEPRTELDSVSADITSVQPTIPTAQVQTSTSLPLEASKSGAISSGGTKQVSKIPPDKEKEHESLQ
jgi:hypothetical protein